MENERQTDKFKKKIHPFRTLDVPTMESTVCPMKKERQSESETETNHVHVFFVCFVYSGK